MVCRRWTVALAFLAAGNVFAQLREIDSAKLPSDEKVQRAYSRVLPIEAYARNWSTQWRYPVPKGKVAAALKASLHDLESAETATTGNEELWLLSAVVGHLAYNVDVNEAYQPTMQALENARKLVPTDYRANWFLGIHRCQAADVKAGMEQLIAIENEHPWRSLPVDFWDDYVSCATASVMPAHALRAIDHAEQLGSPPANYAPFLDIAEGRYIKTDAKTTYKVREVWQASTGKSDVQLTSQLCGIRFSAHGDWLMDLRDFVNGTCVAIIGTGPYHGRAGDSAPNLLLMTRPAKPEETLEQFAQSLMGVRHELARPVATTACPAAKCLAFDIVDKSMYQDEGGGHLLTVAFAGESPDFPGLLFEQPDDPPKQISGKVAYLRPTPKLHRLRGTLYSIVLLDSNASIFENARQDFRFLLQSMQLD